MFNKFNLITKLQAVEENLSALQLDVKPNTELYREIISLICSTLKFEMGYTCRPSCADALVQMYWKSASNDWCARLLADGLLVEVSNEFEK